MDFEKQEFFHKGQYFENEEDFWKSVNEWNENNVSEADWDSFFKDLQKTVTLNLQIWNKEITGKQMNTMFERMIKAFVDSV